MKIAYGTRYCTCAGINSWLRYLMAATRHRVAWGVWYTKGYPVAQEDMRLLADVNFGGRDFGDYLRLMNPDIVMITYGPVVADEAYTYRAETGTPVIMVLHGKADFSLASSEFINKADVVVVPSETMERDFGKWEGLEDTELKIIPHGVIDFSGLNIRPYPFREDFNIPDDHTVVGWAGRIDSEKGWETAREVIRKSEDLPLSFVVAGIGRPQYTGHFLDEVNERENLHWAKCVPLNSMPAFYEATDIGISTSPYESFGLAVCEMSMQKVPVVAIRCGAIEEVLGDKAILVDDADGMVNGIMSLLDPEVREDMGSRARMRMIGKRFRAQRMGDDYLKLWESLLNGE